MLAFSTVGKYGKRAHAFAEYSPARLSANSRSDALSEFRRHRLVGSA